MPITITVYSLIGRPTVTKSYRQSLRTIASVCYVPSTYSDIDPCATSVRPSVYTYSLLFAAYRFHCYVFVMLMWATA